MKRILFALLVLVGCLSALANSTTPVVSIENVGTTPVPSCSSFAAGVDMVYVGNGTWAVGVSVCGLGVGGFAGNYKDWGSQYSSSGVSFTAGDPNIQIVSWSGPIPDANGSPTWTLYLAYNPPACSQNYAIVLNNTASGPNSPTITFSDGTVAGPYPPFPPAPDPLSSQTENLTEGCNLTYVITWRPEYVSEPPSTNPPPEVTNPNLPDVSTNEQPVTDQNPTNETLPSVPSNSSSNILWTASPAPNGGGSTDQSVHDLGNGLNNTLWTASQQNNLDLSAVVSAIDSAKQQAHTDAGTLKSAIDTGREQNHSDLSAMETTLQGMTNLTGNLNLTNYALNSTVAGVGSNVLFAGGEIGSNVFQVGQSINSNLVALIAAQTNDFGSGLGTALTNASGAVSVLATDVLARIAFDQTNNFGFQLQGGLSNTVSAVNGLANSISNVTDLTNLDIASENTLEGGTNLLGVINSNLVAHTITNYNLETTQAGISNLLAGISTNVGNVWSNGLTLEQLTNQVSDYQGQLSNSQDEAMSQMATLTNQASQMGMGTVVSAVQSGLPGNVEYSSGGGVAPQVITLASGVSFSLGSNMPSYGPLRQVLAWATIVGLFLWNWRTTYSKIRDVFTANQAHTSGTELFGSNVNLSSAMLMAVAIFAAATAIPTFAVAVLTNEVSLFISVGSPLSMMQGFGWGYSFLDQYIPLATVVSAVTTRVVFNVVIDSIAAVVMAIKLFLVGL